VAPSIYRVVTAEVELRVLVVWLHRKGEDLKVAVLLLDDVEGLVDQALVEQVALQEQVARRPADATGGGRRTLLAGDAARLLQRARDARLEGDAERRERRADA